MFHDEYCEDITPFVAIFLLVFFIMYIGYSMHKDNKEYDTETTATVIDVELVGQAHTANRYVTYVYDIDSKQYTDTVSVSATDYYTVGDDIPIIYKSSKPTVTKISKSSVFSVQTE